MKLFKAISDAYIFNNYTAPFLYSLSLMSQELEHIMEVNNIKPQKEPNKKQRHKKRRKK